MKRNIAISLFTAVLVMMSLLLTASAAKATQSAAEAYFLSLLNGARETELSESDALAQYASDRCSDMVENHYFSEVSLDGKNIYQRMSESGLENSSRTEKIGMILFKGFIGETKAATMLFDNMAAEDLETATNSGLFSTDYNLAGISIQTVTWQAGVTDYNAYICVIALGSTSTRFDAQMFNLINQFRSAPDDVAGYYGFEIDEKSLSKNLRPLEISRQLSESVLLHATDMLSQGYESTVSLSGTVPYERAVAQGYFPGVITEKVGHLALCDENGDYSQGAERLFETLLEGELQAESETDPFLLNSSYTEIGIARSVGESESFVSVCGNYVQVYAIDLASQYDWLSNSTAIYGVCYIDTNNNGLYDAGEGVEGRDVQAINSVSGEFVSTVTNAAGGWKVNISVGEVTISVTNGTMITEKTIYKNGYAHFCGIKVENSLTSQSNKY